jgi:iron(III) transport system permease protein
MAVSIGVLLAWITTRTNIPFARLLDLLVLLPIFIAPLLGAVGWALLASPGRGALINGVIMSIGGLDEPPISIYSQVGIIWVMGLYYVPFTYLFTAAALRSMEPSLEESAAVLGSGHLRTALRITIPLVMPAVVGSSLLVFTLGMSQFGVPALLGTPFGYSVLSTRMYDLIRSYTPDYAGAAAMGISLFIFTGLGVYLQLRILGTRQYTTVTGRGLRPRLIDAGVWRLPLFVLVCSYVVVAAVLPLGAIALASSLGFLTTDLSQARFTLDNFEYVLLIRSNSLDAVRNSLVLAVLCGILIVMLSAVMGWFLIRTRVRGRSGLEYLSMVPLGIPGIAFSVGLLWAWIRFPSPVPIYGTVAILVIAYVTLFLPYGVRAVLATLRQIDRSLEECAHICGASWGRVLRTITLPLLRPGLWAGWTLIFISVMQELPASALLTTSRTPVLAVTVFDLWWEGTFTRVAALALIQALVILVVLVVVRRVGHAEGFALQ